MWIPRYIEAHLKHSARTRPVIVLTGARQTGKTSTFLHLFPDYAFVSLDLPTEAEQAEKEPERFLQRHPPPVIIDEVPYAPGLFRHLKVAVDAHRSRNGQFLLTGSQKFTLMKNVSESLAGRADIVELETLSFAEIREALPKTGLETAIVRGGFPELNANPEIDPVAFYNSYLATYLERDVRALTNVGSLRDFERFLRACALRSANLLNKADLARDVGIAPSTANQWLSMLVASGQAVLLEPWFSNRTKSIVKSPKLYLADTGLLCALLNIRSEGLFGNRRLPERSGRHLSSPSFATANAAQDEPAASFSGATEAAKWTFWWMRADALSCLKRNGRNCLMPAIRSISISCAARLVNHG